MAAVTADTLVLPRVKDAGLGDTERPVLADLDRADRLRGRGLPGAPHHGRHQLQAPRPVHHDGSHGRGGLRRRRAPRHQLAPAPRLRDGHLPDRRPVHPPGHPRRRRRDPRGLDPVDDRRRRAAAHRDPAGEARRGRRAVQRLPAVGEPAGRQEVPRAGLPAGRGVGPAAAGQRRRRRAAARHRR